MSVLSCTQLRPKKHKNTQTKLLKTTLHINFILVGLFAYIFSYLLVTCWNLFVISSYIWRLRFWIVFVIYNDDFVTSSFCSVIWRFVESMFYRICRQNIPFVSRNLHSCWTRENDIYLRYNQKLIFKRFVFKDCSKSHLSSQSPRKITIQ